VPWWLSEARPFELIRGNLASGPDSLSPVYFHRDAYQHLICFWRTGLVSLTSWEQESTILRDHYADIIIIMCCLGHGLEM
jgi:hypothetical protein